MTFWMENCPKEPYMQRFEKLGLITTTNENFEKSLLVFQMFGAFATIICKYYYIINKIIKYD